MADLWVMNSQKWLNTAFSSVSGVPKVAEDGVTGWGTMYALTRALQHELGITALSDSFGSGTESSYVSKIGTIKSTTSARIVGILQCALWCKGYTGGTVIGKWDQVITASVANVRRDVGLASGDIVDAKLMKSLLTLDAYVRLGTGTEVVRAGQQWLNSRYSSRADYYLVPCDGRFTRDVQRGLMLAIQYEIGMADGVANGNFGPGTQSGLKAQGVVASGSTDNSQKFVSLFQLALAFNGYDVSRSGTFSAATRTSTLDFQRFLEIAASGNGDYDTWAALLVSTGNPDRPVKGFDTTTALTKSFATARHAEGYRIVGRYLTVTGKSIAPGELDIIFDAGLKVIPIFQNFNNGPEYFTHALGLDHGQQAALRGRQLGLKGGSTIFFAVDYDAFASEIDKLIAPYFQGIADGLRRSASEVYKIGIYATRNIAAEIAGRGLASAVWVSGMSTGYSGNLGYPMPAAWSYNQIQELHAINIDRNAVSVRAQPTTRADVERTPDYDETTKTLWWNLVRQEVLAEEAIAQQSSYLISSASDFVLHFLMSRCYTGMPFPLYLPAPEASTTGQVQQQYAVSRTSYMSKAGRPDAPGLGDLYVGGAPASPDAATALEHMAATALGVKVWGTHEGHPGMGVGDLGGWALDLVTLWRDYRDHVAKQGPTKISDFVDAFLGDSKNVSTFDQGDLIADADGWLVGAGMRSGLRFSQSFSKVLCDNPDWKARLELFLRSRFTGPDRASAIRSAVRGVFNAWPYPSAPRELFLKERIGPNATELDAFATAVATRLCRLAGI